MSEKNTPKFKVGDKVRDLYSRRALKVVKIRPFYKYLVENEDGTRQWQSENFLRSVQQAEKTRKAKKKTKF